MKEGVKVPNVTFRVRVPDENGEYGWADMPSDSIFKGKKVAVFSLPGAFTPTCSSFQLPGYEEKYDELKKHVDEVYCLSVNDSFVMNAWAKDMAVENVKMIPDGAGHFTRSMGMLVQKPMQNFGMRSWRYSMLVDNGEVKKIFEEPGKNNASDDDDPFTVSDVDTMLNYLKEQSV